MDDRRRVHRREPIIVEFDGGRTFTASPLPWLRRNDLGDEIVAQNAEAVNTFVKLYTSPDTNIPQLEAKLDEKITNPSRILALAYPDNKIEDFDDCVWDEIVELIFASLEVNQLERLKVLVDPNRVSPTPVGGTSSSEAGEDLLGRKIESSVSSSFSDSPEAKPLISPTGKSLVSSESGENKSGTSDTGS